MRAGIRDSVCILCGLIQVYVVSASPCDIGWFGTRCQYKCHCRDSQCDDQGECTDGSGCEKGWFGPACQYQDIASTGRVISLPTQDQDLILDGDDSTCHENLQQLIVSWSMNYPFTWLRITVSDTEPSALLNLTILLKPYKSTDTTMVNNPYTKCHNQRMAFINHRTVDVYCDTTEGLQEILLFGVGIRTLCSVYVSGGRNVALKETAWQSSTEKDIEGVASRAVDGQWLGLFKDNSCTHTAVSDRTPVWKLTLSHPVAVSRFEILNRNDCCQRRLMFFTLETKSQDNTSIHYYRDGSTTPHNSFTILSPEPKDPITTLIISAHNEWNKYVVLTLCEVEMYGDTACPVGKFGRECEQTCNCAVKDGPCLASTGNCLSGCAAGYQGEGCRTECPPHFWGVDCLKNCSDRHCVGNKCNRVTGVCGDGCVDGYKPPDCTQVCDLGSYGANCTQTCPENCLKGSCNHVTGSCFQCKIGFQGDHCHVACDRGHHGLNCSSSCPVNCDGQNCNPGTGHCYSCKRGFKGESCQEECEEGVYGVNCSQKCPNNCNGKKCNHVTGKCDICKIGYHGDKCDKECEVARWGQNCSSHCPSNCFNGSCDKTTGRCDKGCIHGYQEPDCLTQCDVGSHGIRCSLRCPLTCEGQRCDAVTGHCRRCTPGYTGVNCQEVCEEGLHGTNCTQSCPVNCLGNNCHHVTGQCNSCKPGYQGPGCDTDCDEGSYGANCSNPCPENCSGKKCDPMNGNCDFCKPGYQGDRCEQACSDGTWGPNCSEPCPTGCRAGCDVITGSCAPDCREGGPDSSNCRRVVLRAGSGMAVDHMTQEPSAVYPVFGLMIAFLLVCNAVLVCENKRLKRIKGSDSSVDSCDGAVIPTEESCILKGKTRLDDLSTANSIEVDEILLRSKEDKNLHLDSNGTIKNSFNKNTFT